MNTNIYIDGGNIINIRQNKNNNNIEYSINQSNNWIIINFPFFITNTNTDLGFVKVYFTTNIDITDLTQYFVCNSNNIQFGSDSLNPGGTKSTINVEVNNYDGFIDNAANYSNILIFNLFLNGIDKTNGTIYSTNYYAGWICREDFNGLNNYIINCSSNGDIGLSGGGIVGMLTNNSSGPLYIIGCSSSGVINGDNAGGIVGNNNNDIIINSCWSSGSIIGDGAGGIIGAFCNNLQITNCYSTGEITGYDTGGIVGRSVFNCTITNCYSTGNILSGYSGGICGSSSRQITIKNCYTTGNKNDVNAGGILGYINNNISSTYNIQNCYVTGTTTENKGYIIGGNTNENGTNGKYNITNCYSEAYHNSYGWNNLRANNVLLGGPASSPGVGNYWVSIDENNSPYRIFNIGYTPYSNKIIDKNTTTNKYNLIRTYSSFVLQDEFSSGAIINFLSYKILKITGGDTNSYNSISIDENNGVITTSLSTSPGTYTIYINNKSDADTIDPLYFTTYELTVNSTTKTPIISIIYMKNLFTDNSLVYYKAHSLSCGGIGTVKNYKAKCYKT